ncbi:diguanylate cyclase (GGDEF)-like protein [Onishia taeanensis]|uniref:Diguanylate cyclase (GGDEF)-like protein n=2 Tax=Onishia taeanensis TaxID=284577 RepID=A0A328XWW5_9GAMM|nr:diguanylate cyclase (GGDEF)-like protein [Halomonas taeanensis]
MRSFDVLTTTEWRDRGDMLPAIHHLKRCVSLALLLLMGTWIVYATGGTAYAYPYLMLAPVLIGAFWYALVGGLCVAFAAGILMAFMPQDAALSIEQSTSNYLVRIAQYLLLGGVSGWLFLLRRRSASRHRTMARTDPLSGLANQVALNEDLGRHLDLPATRGATTGLMLVRITDITDVIDAMGLDAADELVLSLSERLKGAVCGKPFAYRINHDELALILHDIDLHDIERIATRLLDVGEESYLIQQVPVRMQLAIGSSLRQGDTVKQEDLVREARIALFTAIQEGSDHKHFSPGFERHSLDSLQLIARVRCALQEKEFSLHYQPKICLVNGHVCGSEGLIRWPQADGSLVPPGQFMPKVENTSLINPVTHFVAREAASFACRHAGWGAISINLSVHNLYDDELIDLLIELVEQVDLTAEWLEVEITETALIGDLAAARRAIQRIRDAGIGVSIDDFGTGFASFEYLQHLPITGLKIDRTFVAQLEVNARARKLMACMIEMGHALDLTVTAEGVETQGQADILRELGCDQAQGFFYTGALPASDYLAWCQAHANTLP